MVVACRSAAGAMGAHIMVRGSDDEGLLGHTQARGGGGGTPLHQACSTNETAITVACRNAAAFLGANIMASHKVL